MRQVPHYVQKAVTFTIIGQKHLLLMSTNDESQEIGSQLYSPTVIMEEHKALLIAWVFNTGVERLAIRI